MSLWAAEVVQTVLRLAAAAATAAERATMSAPVQAMVVRAVVVRAMVVRAVVVRAVVVRATGADEAAAIWLLALAAAAAVAASDRTTPKLLTSLLKM